MRSAILAVCVVYVAADAPIAEDVDWLAFPSKNGAVLIHKDCVHHFEDDLALPHGPCPHASRYPKVSYQVLNETLSEPDDYYYSDWVAYTETTGDFGYMSSDWVVPKAPTSHGPVPGISSTYLFNGLEDGGGEHGKASYILQPVLSYGKSGCNNDPLNFFRWYLTSFSVSGNGRAACGKKIAVDEGESVRGTMQLESDGTSWSTISIRLKNNDTSVAKTDLAGKQPNAAYISLEGMVIYNCRSFSDSGSITFEKNVLKDRNGNSIQPEWKPMIRHSECNQQVKINTDTSVTLSWDTSKTNAVVV